MIRRGTVQRWTVAPPGEYDRPWNCTVAPPGECDRWWAFAIWSATARGHEFHQTARLVSTVRKCWYPVRPLLLGSYFKSILPCTAGTTDSLAQPFNCATVTVGLIFQVHFTVHCWNNKQSCTAVFLRNRFLAQALIRNYFTVICNAQSREVISPSEI
jgi:hypothetical protein